MGVLLAIAVLFMAGCTTPNTPGEQGNQTVTNTSTGENVVVPQNVQSDLATIVKDIFFLQYGQDLEVEYDHAVDKGSFIEVIYKVEGNAVPVYISPDYEYVYSVLQAPQKRTEALDQLNAARKQLEDRLKPPEVKTKSDKPKVELFVMSYCPYGLQAEKALLPVVDLLGDKVDFNIKFVNYAMHPNSGEVEENTVQYCIQKEQKDKYWDYLKCFVDKGDQETCLDQAGIDKDKLNTCYNSTFEKYGLQEILDDQSKWLSGRFPAYPIDDSECKEYGVQGSPTLVINGEVVNNVGRNPEAFKEVICSAFQNQPEECNEQLSSQPMPPMFGYNGQAPATEGSCG